MSDIRLTFWGTRGSFPCSGPQYIRYGGNTCCVELRCGEHTVVLDAGSGSVALGERLLRDPPKHIDLLLTHYHFDHICGLPFFAPFHHPGIEVSIVAGQSSEWPGAKAMLDSFMTPPLFPITPKIFQATLDFRHVDAGDDITLPSGLDVSTAPLIHPQGATGYRITYAGKSVAYVTDTEMPDDTPTPEMLELAEDADILVLDSMFTDDELPMCRGWGHSSWRQCIEFADRVNAKTLFLFHHHPQHDDDAMDEIAAVAAAARPGTRVAREGDTVTI